MRILHLILAATAIAGSLQSACFAQGSDNRDLNVEQMTAYSAGRPRPSSLVAQVWTDRPDNTFSLNEALRLFVQPNEDAYLTVLNVGPTGKVTQLFPNAFQSSPFVPGRQVVEIPAPNSGARITVAGPVGAELIKVIASSRPITLVPETQLEGGGMFRTVLGGVSAVARNLEVTLDSTAPDHKVTVANHIIRTVVNRPVGAGPGAGPSSTVVIIPGSTIPQESAALPSGAYGSPAGAPFVMWTQPAQPFPLLVALDRPSYRIGERVTLAVTSTQSCNLVVYDIGSSGQARVVFPNRLMQTGQITAMQTLFISGGPSPVSIEASGPTGTEQIVAACSTDPMPLSPPAGEYSQNFSPFGTRDAVQRDLSLLASRPAGTTAMASAFFVVQP